MSQLNIATLANLAGSETTPIADVINGSARAWVNFNGTGTVAIRASYNVSSITDNGTGNYTVNFTNALPDSNYSAIPATVGANATNTATGVVFQDYATALATTSVRVTAVNNSNAAADRDMSVAIFR